MNDTQKKVPVLTLVGTAQFATGAAFSIEQVDAKEWYAITDLRTGKVTGYASSVAKAWGSVAYQAQISPNRHTTQGVKATSAYWSAEDAALRALHREAV